MLHRHPERFAPPTATTGNWLPPTADQGWANSLHQDDHHPLPEAQRAALFPGIVEQGCNQQVRLSLSLGLQRFQHAEGVSLLAWLHPAKEHRLGRRKHSLSFIQLPRIGASSQGLPELAGSVA
jgi:hypothetical protein